MDAVEIFGKVVLVVLIVAALFALAVTISSLIVAFALNGVADFGLETKEVIGLGILLAVASGPGSVSTS